ncbi:DUF2975 domain-containing protein [Pseudoxanthomonas mexicana]
MSRMPARALAAARPLILGLTVINLGYAAIIISLLCASFLVEGWPWKPLGFDLATMSPQAPLGLRAIMVIGIVCAVIVHTILRRLLAIVDTVRGGDAFVASNAQRLSAIAWSVLTIELMRLAVLAISGAVALPGKMTGLSPTPWLAVLLLFVLSGVFAHGARMRTDLEGTV